METAQPEEMPSKKSTSPTMEFVLGHLRKNPKAEFGEVKAAAASAGLTVYPVVYGRAKALLGLVKVSPRGSGKVAKAAKARSAKAAAAAAAVEAQELTRAAPARGRAKQPARSNWTSPIESLEAMIEDMKGVAVDRDRYLQALEKIADILDEALAD